MNVEFALIQDLQHLGSTVIGLMHAGSVAASGGLNAGLGAALPNHASYPGAGNADLLRQGKPSARCQILFRDE